MGLSVSPNGEPDRRPLHPFGGDPDAFAIGVEQDGATLRLRMTGELDWACISRVEDAMAHLAEGRIKRVVFDLQKLKFMDSAGLRTILRANDRARAEHFDLIVVRPRGLANRVFTLTRASKQLTLVDRPETADTGI